MKKTFALLLMLVFSLGISVHAATLPTGYTEVEHVTSSGGAYFDSGLYATAETKIEAKFSYTKEGAYLYGASSSGNTKTLSACLKGSATANWRLIDSKAAVQLSTGDVHTTVHDASGVRVDGVLVANDKTPAADTTTTGTFLIGNLRGNSGGASGSSYQFEGDIYSVKIYEGGVLVRNYVPCYRNSDNVVGLYDTVGGTFHASEGSGEFKLAAQQQEISLNAAAGIAVNAVTGEVYGAKEPDLEHAMASTTKIMTALLSIENLDPDSRTLPAIASDQVGSGNTRIDLEIGEQLTVRDALYGLMLPSGNDAANLLGRTVAGSYEAFTEMMNEKAKEIGCEHTCFTTVSGTDAPGHYTTAAEYAMIANYAMQYELFRAIVSTTHYTIEAEPAYGVVRRELKNTNYLLPGLDLDGTVYSYEGVIGIKTGTTGDAGACLVTAAEKNGTELVTVVFGASGNTSSTNRFTESIKLLDHGFETAAAQPYTVVAEGNTITATNPATGYVMSATISAPDVALTGDKVEPAVVRTTYPDGTHWHTNWEVTYTNNDKVGTATASISFGGKTASCEFNIVESVVTMTEDYAEVSSLVIPAGQTYDLDGGVLAVLNGLVVNKGGKIINGVLNVADGAVVNLGDNGGWVPVLDADYGTNRQYILYPADIKAGKNVVSTIDGTKYSFGYKLTAAGAWYDPYGDVIDASAAGAVKLGVELKLDGATADYSYKQESIAKMDGISAAASSSEFFKINLNLAGSNNDLTKVRVAPVIKVFDLGFRYVGEATGEGSGEYVARINTKGYYTLEDAIAAVTELGVTTDVKLVGDVAFKRPVTIKLNGLTRFITLSRSNIEISGPVTFDGMSDEGTVSDTTLFRVYGASALTLKDGVVIRDINNTRAAEDNYHYGAVVRAENGTFTMDGVTVENCSSPNRGVVYISNSSAVANIRNSTFTNNTARKNFGGAIAVNSATSVNVENCDFTGNKAASFGGAVGVYTNEVSVTLKNNTYTNNACGASYCGGAIGLHSDAIGEMTVVGGMFSGNTVDDIGKGGGTVTLEGEIKGLDAISLTAGQYVTVGETLALDESTSVAVKGAMKNITIPAAEVNAGTYITENGMTKTLVTYVAAVGDTKYTSLAAAIEATKDATTATVIELYGDDTVTAATTVTLNPNVQIKVTADAVVSGPLTIDGANKAHTAAVPIVVNGCKLTLQNGVKLQNIVSTYTQSSSYYHGIIRVQSSGELLFDGVTVSKCSAPYGLIGGQSNTVSFTVKNSVFADNESEKSGGVFFAYGAPFVLENSTFTGNSSGKNGGVFHSGLSSSTLTATNCTFTNNTAAGSGGAISVYSGKTYTFDGCTFSGNKAAGGVSDDCWYRGGTLYLKGETSMETIRMEAGKALVLNDAASFTGTITLIGAGAASGSTVLMGTKVADYYSYFAPSDTTLTINASGTIVAK